MGAPVARKPIQRKDSMSRDLYRKSCVIFLGICFFFGGRGLCEPEPDSKEFEKWWVQRFQMQELPWSSSHICQEINPLPSFSVTPTATGTQAVRISLPFSAGAFPEGLQLEVHHKSTILLPQVRILTLHPCLPRCVRQAILTFPFHFHSLEPHAFSLKLVISKARDIQPVFSMTESASGTWEISWMNRQLTLTERALSFRIVDSQAWKATLIAPTRESSAPPRIEIVETGPFYHWIRFLYPDARWPRILEYKMDNLGTVSARIHLQRVAVTDGYCPGLGWDVQQGELVDPMAEENGYSIGGALALMLFEGGEPFSIPFGKGTLSFPEAHFLRKGMVQLDSWPAGVRATYNRASENDRVPHQPMAWRTAGFVVSATGQVEWNHLDEPLQHVTISNAADHGEGGASHSGIEGERPILKKIMDFHRDAILDSALRGDDFGNVTHFQQDAHPSIFGMNRLNHCLAIFREYEQTADPRLRTLALDWCRNFYNLSIWWGRDETFGGTRYNNANAAGDKAHQADQSFMWRSNFASHFCTKGFASFYLAYEETGDPRMSSAFTAQADYVRSQVHAVCPPGEPRNIGLVEDLLRSAEWTGEEQFTQDALRLFRELRTCMNGQGLFSQSCQPIVADLPFIDEDQVGYNHPFAKPYILGYALTGLPGLLDLFPEEERLSELVHSVAVFQADSIDPVGGWRYPHPRSTSCLVSQGMEHAWQLCRVMQSAPSVSNPPGKLLDAVEKVLQNRILVFLRTGTLMSRLSGWEKSAGTVTDATGLSNLYRHPEDRDPARDYSEGEIDLGSSPPEGLVYFNECLRFYLRHRPGERLFQPNEALAQVLERMEDRRLSLVPEPGGTRLRISHPRDPDVCAVLWGPEWTTFPPLSGTPQELGGMELNWRNNPEMGTWSCQIDRPEGTLAAEFTPSFERIDVVYTIWPHEQSTPPSSVDIGPCLQLYEGIFGGPAEDFLPRIFFHSLDGIHRMADIAGNHSRNILSLAGSPSQDLSPEMIQSGWTLFEQPALSSPAVGAVSHDGKWIIGTVREGASSISSNADPSHCCIHSQGTVPLDPQGPTTLRASVHLFSGTCEEMIARLEKDRAAWRSTPALPASSQHTCLYGVQDHLPIFHRQALADHRFQSAYQVDSEMDFQAWRTAARSQILEAFQDRLPGCPFEPVLICEEDRGTYTAQKVAFNLSPVERVAGYLLIPKGKGTHPAIIALHDHGAHFSIGKEKVIRPVGESAECIRDASEWVAGLYGGRFIGDELAQQGYVVFAMDALYWGSRGSREEDPYARQQALASNLFQLGMSWAGTIVQQDLRSVEFVRSLAQVDPERIGAVGLSMGANRVFHLLAATDHVQVGAAICWMTTTRGVLQPGNNQTLGQSAFSMLHPGLRSRLDYPHVAAAACPRPMLFYCGEQDALFPADSVKEAFQYLRGVWDHAGAGENLITQCWPTGHVFSVEMQDKVFEFMGRHLKNRD